MFTLALAVFREILREPAALILFLLSALLILLSPLTAIFIFGDQVRFSADAGLASLLFLSLAFAFYSAMQLERELHSGLPDLLLSRSLNPSSWLVGRHLGFVGAVLILVLPLVALIHISLSVARLQEAELSIHGIYLWCLSVFVFSSLWGLLLHLGFRRSFSSSFLYSTAFLFPILAMLVQPESDVVAPSPLALGQLIRAGFVLIGVAGILISVSSFFSLKFSSFVSSFFLLVFFIASLRVYDASEFWWGLATLEPLCRGWREWGFEENKSAFLSQIFYTIIYQAGWIFLSLAFFSETRTPRRT